jgi:hypothetical protein
MLAGGIVGVLAYTCVGAVLGIVGAAAMAVRTTSENAVAFLAIGGILGLTCGVYSWIRAERG